MSRRLAASLILASAFLAAVFAVDLHPPLRAWLDSVLEGAAPERPAPTRAPEASAMDAGRAAAAPVAATPPEPAAPASATLVTEGQLEPAANPAPAPAMPALDAAPAVAVVAAPGGASSSEPAPDRSPPAPPPGLAVEATGERATHLRWERASDDVGVTGYEVVRDGKVIASGPELETAEDGLPPLARVCYEVVALDAAGNRSRPCEAACVTLPDRTPPTPPTSVAARPTSETSVALAWSGATDAGGIASYEVVRAGTVAATTASSETADEGLEASRTYCWTVRARDPSGNVSADSPQACATTPDRTPPTSPPRLAAGPGGSTRVAFAWDPATDNVGVDRYEVFRGGRLVARTGATKRGGVEDGLVPSTEYCYTVVALDRAGNRSVPAGPACASTVEPGVPSGPTTLQASARSASVVVLSWDSSPDPGMVYAVYWDGNRRIGATPRTEYTVAGLKAGERRCFRVAAVDGSGNESPRTIETCAAAQPSPPAGAGGP